MQIRLLWLVVGLLAGACGGAQGEEAIGRSHHAPSSNERLAASTSNEPVRHGAQHGHHTKHHAFDDAAAWSKMFDDPERDAWQKPAVVVRALNLDPGMTVADIGAGTGYFEGPLSEAVGDSGEVHAIDIAPQMVEFMAARAAKDGWNNVTAKVAQPDDPGLVAASMHRVLVVNTWHHIEDRVRYAQKIHRALRPGGYLLVVDFSDQSPHGPPATERVQAERVREELMAAGFDLAHPVSNELPYQYMVRAGRSDKLVDIPAAILLGRETLFGGQPSEQHLDEIKEAGYRQVISLRADGEPGAEGEQQSAQARGLRFLSIPVEGADGLNETNARALFLALKSEPQTVVHCGSGNRAGALMGLATRCAGASIEQALQTADMAGVKALRAALEAKLRAGLCSSEPEPQP